MAFTPGAMDGSTKVISTMIAGKGMVNFWKVNNAHTKENGIKVSGSHSTKTIL